MSHTLSELVQSAVRQAAAIPARTKVASASSSAGSQVREALEKRSSAEPSAHSPATLDNCAYGIKLAEALDVSSNLLRQKLAREEPLRTPDHNHLGSAPQVKAKPPTQSKATSTLTAGDVQTNEEDHTGNVDYSNNKEAALDFIQMKLAQAEVFSQVGDHASAAKALEAAEREKLAHYGTFDRMRHAVAKVACEMPTDSSVGGLRMRDNAGMISLTKAEAKRLTQNEAAQFFSANVTKDPVLPWASSHSGTAKVASGRISAAFGRAKDLIKGDRLKSMTNTRSGAKARARHAAAVRFSEKQGMPPEGLQSLREGFRAANSEANKVMAARLGLGLGGLGVAGGTAAALRGRGDDEEKVAGLLHQLGRRRG